MSCSHECRTSVSPSLTKSRVVGFLGNVCASPPEGALASPALLADWVAGRTCRSGCSTRRTGSPRWGRSTLARRRRCGGRP
eukprot:7759675-Pyramimonas_sp.AAC.2